MSKRRAPSRAVAEESEPSSAGKIARTGIFANIDAVFVGRQDVQLKVIVGNFTKAGGRVIEDEAAPITHIFCRKQTTLKQASTIKQARGDAATSAVFVSIDWLTDCLKASTLVPVEPFFMFQDEEKSESLNESHSSATLSAAATVVSQAAQASSSSASSFGSASSSSSSSTSSSSPPASSSKPYFPVSAAFQSVERSAKYELLQQDTMYVLECAGVNDSGKLACFDLDSTLIVTASGATFAKDIKDWQFLHPSNIVSRLQKLCSDGYQVVIITNQGGIGKGKLTISAFAKKLLDIHQKSGVSFRACISTVEDKYRKPCTHMWHTFAAFIQAKAGVSVDMVASFYVGDAAGRPAGWTKGVKKDFSCSDRQFALNLGLTFHTPEAFFFGQAEAVYDLGFNPRAFVQQAEQNLAVLVEQQQKLAASGSKQEMVVFCGFPGSGKSTAFRAVFQPLNYVHVNRDTLKTPAKCLQVAREALQSGKSVVIDNTNPSADARSPFVDLAKQLNCPVRCFSFDAPREAAEHMNEFRHLSSRGKIESVPSIAYNMYKSKFQPPSAVEGFASVAKFPFVPQFASLEDRELFCQFLGA